MTYTTPIDDQAVEFEALKLRLARYNPQRLTTLQRDSMLADIRAAVLAAKPNDSREAVRWMTYVTGFIHDVAPETGGSFDHYFTDAMISTWVSRSVLAGKAQHALNTRRGALKRILRAHRGLAVGKEAQPSRQRMTAPLALVDAQRLHLACTKDSRSALRGFAAHVLCGVPAGTRGAHFVDNDETTIVSAKGTWVAAPIGRARANLDDDYLIDEDWRALKDVANTLGLHLSWSVATQTFRLLAVSDQSLPLGERFERYGLSSVAVDAICPYLVNDQKWEMSRDLLRGTPIAAVCATSRTSALSGRPRIRGPKEGGQVLTRKTSRAAAKRLSDQRIAEKAQRAAKAAPIEDYLAAFVPDQDDAVWESIAATVRETVARSQLSNIQAAKAHAVTLTAFLRWRASVGQSTTPADALTFATIDAYHVHGMPDLGERSRRDYRSRLRHMAVRVHASVDAPPSLRLGHNQVNPGYTPGEEATLRRVALTQSQPEVRRRLCAIVGFCAGAGLSSSELRALQRGDVAIDDDGTITVNVRGDRPRRTAVRRLYERHVAVALAGLKPGQTVLPVLKSSSPITVILKEADLFGDSPDIDTRRLRTTWITWLMTQRIPLQLAFEASGLQSARTFYDQLAHLSTSSSVSELRDGGAR